MFGFVRFDAKPFIRTRKTTPPNTAGTPSLLKTHPFELGRLQNGQIVVAGTAAVPEPGTVLLLVAALGVAWILRYRASPSGGQ